MHRRGERVRKACEVRCGGWARRFAAGLGPAGSSPIAQVVVVCFGWRLKWLRFEKHLNDFLKVLVEFVQTLSLTVCPAKARNVSHKKARLGATLNNRRVCPHVRPVLL